MRGELKEGIEPEMPTGESYDMHTPGRFGTVVIMQRATTGAFLVSHSHWEQGFRAEERVIFYKPIDSLDQFFKEVLPAILRMPEVLGIQRDWTPAELGDLCTGMYLAALKVSPGHAKAFRSCLSAEQRADIDQYLAMIKKNAKVAKQIEKYGGRKGH